MGTETDFIKSDDDSVAEHHPPSSSSLKTHARNQEEDEEHKDEGKEDNMVSRRLNREHNNDDKSAPLTPSEQWRRLGQRLLEEKENNKSTSSKSNGHSPNTATNQFQMVQQQDDTIRGLGVVETTTQFQETIQDQEDTISGTAAPAANQGNGFFPVDEGSLSLEAEAQIAQLRDQLIALKVQQEDTNRGLGVMETATQFQETIQDQEDTISGTAAPAANQGNGFFSVDEGSLSLEAEAQIAQLREQLVALKVRTQDREEDLGKVQAKLKEECEAMRDLEEDHFDMQHDLAEMKRVSGRLEKENNFLRKKVSKREAENNRLQARVDNLTGVTGDESNFGRMEYEELPEDLLPREPKPSMFERSSSAWKLLADEAISEKMQCSTTPSMESKGGILDNFFRSSSSTIASFADMSVLTGSSSHSRTDGIKRPISRPRGGTRPAA